MTRIITTSRVTTHAPRRGFTDSATYTDEIPWFDSFADVEGGRPWRAEVPFQLGGITHRRSQEYWIPEGSDRVVYFLALDEALRFQGQPPPPPSRPPTRNLPRPEGLVIPRKTFPALDPGSFARELERQGLDPALAAPIGRALEERFQQWALDEEANYRAIEVWSTDVAKVGEDDEPEP